MKKILIILGVVFLVLIVAIGAFIGIAAYKGSQLDASSKAYVDENIPPIISTWSKDELLKRASPELKDAATDEQFDKMFVQLSKLGSLQKYDPAQGSSLISVTTQHGKVIGAKYTANTSFQNGTATIYIKLIQHHGQWQILSFYVKSPLFPEN